MIAFKHMLRLVFLVAIIGMVTAELTEPIPEKRENLLDIARRLMIRGTGASASVAAQTSSAPVVAAASTSVAAAHTSAAETSAQATSAAASSKADATSAAAAATTSASSTPAAAATTSSPSIQVSSSTPAPPSSSAAATSKVVQTASPSSTKPTHAGSTTTPGPSRETSHVINTSTAGGVTSYVEVTTVVTRVSGSSTYRYTATSSAATFVPTGAASLNGSSSSSGSNGMSSHTKAIIGGVVGGIGGAIVLGGLAIVAWRIWGRGRHEKDEGDELMGTAYGSAPTEKSDRSNMGSAGNPFQSTLESYHGPGQVNTASNF